MNIHPPKTQDWCIICETQCDETSEIIEIDDFMEIIPLQQRFEKNIQSFDIVCSSCVASMEIKNEAHLQFQNPKKRTRFCTSEETPLTSTNSRQTESLWETIIVNQIPMGIVRTELISIFSQYGTIKDMYMCEERLVLGWDSIKNERIARITFSSDNAAWTVWEVSQHKLIKYKDHVLMITLASDNFSPIQNLPDDCLEQIFLHLSSIKDKFNVEKVCKRWNKIGRKSWSNITKITNNWDFDTWRLILSRAENSLQDIFMELDPDADPFLASVADKCVKLRNLKCVLDGRIDYRTCAPYTRTLIQRNQNLRRLQLFFLHVEEADVDFMDVLSTQLEEMDLRSLEYDVNFPVSSDLARFSNLEALKLYSFHIDENQLKGIEKLDNLKKLTIEYCIVHDSNFEYIAELTKLERLSLERTEIPEASLVKILSNSKGLKYLNIGDIEGITDALFQYVQQLSQLQVLSMAGLDQVTDAYFGAMPNISYLDCNMCTSITDEGMRKFFNSASSDIAKLCIWGCRSLTKRFMKISYDWTDRTGKTITIIADSDSPFSGFGNGPPGTPLQLECIDELEEGCCQGDDWGVEFIQSEPIIE